MLLSYLIMLYLYAFIIHNNVAKIAKGQMKYVAQCFHLILNGEK